MNIKRFVLDQPSVGLTTSDWAPIDEVTYQSDDWMIHETLAEISIAETALLRDPANRLLELELASLNNRLLKLQRQGAS